ncbi:GntR family transcriptional regulator [Halomonas shantousis]
MAKTLKEQLYDALTHSIDSGHLESGLVLLEGNIAEIFGMSRSPVRQTLGQLHEEGRICRFDGRGYLVGSRPDEIIRRTLAEADFRAAGGKAQVKRSDEWPDLAGRVERDIVLCSMKGRFELNELQLAKHLQVSRTITHRILLHLQSLGLIEKVKYTGWTVVPLDDERLHNLYEARRQLEPFMIAQASRSMPEQEILGYIEKLDDAARRYPDIKGSLLDELENDLHQRVVGKGGNREIMMMLRRTQPILLVSKHLLGSAIAFPQHDPFFDEHRRVFERMRDRQTELASRALAEHLEHSEFKVMDRLARFRDTGQIEVPGYLS